MKISCYFHSWLRYFILQYVLCGSEFVGGLRRVGQGTKFELWGGHRCLNVIKVRTLCVVCFSIRIVFRYRQYGCNQQLSKFTLQYIIWFFIEYSTIPFCIVAFSSLLYKIIRSAGYQFLRQYEAQYRPYRKITGDNSFYCEQISLSSVAVWLLPLTITQ